MSGTLCKFIRVTVCQCVCLTGCVRACMPSDYASLILQPMLMKSIAWIHSEKFGITLLLSTMTMLVMTMMMMMTVIRWLPKLWRISILSRLSCFTVLVASPQFGSHTLCALLCLPAAEEIRPVVTAPFCSAFRYRRAYNKSHTPAIGIPETVSVTLNEQEQRAKDNIKPIFSSI